MRYFGGKQRIAKHIAQLISEHRKPNQIYYEPFVGAASVFALVPPPKVGSDVVPELIELLMAIRDGWDPPDTITKAEYTRAKEGLITGPLRAFIGFGCSFGGKWFGGYAQSPDRNYATNARNSLLKQAQRLDGVFRVGSFFNLQTKDNIIYCDPPYSGTTKPGKRNNFDGAAFWEHVRHLSIANTVLVSELTAPDDFDVLWQAKVKTDMQSSNRQRIERVFKWRN